VPGARSTCALGGLCRWRWPTTNVDCFVELMGGSEPALSAIEAAEIRQVGGNRQQGADAKPDCGWQKPPKAWRRPELRGWR
jgi:hypothetical protein